MAGNSDGGKRAAATIRARYGRNFYVAIGTEGGKKGKLGGFASTKVGKDGLTGAQRAKQAGALGGKISRRGKATAVRRINVKVLN